MTQFVGCTIGRLSVGKVMKSLLPFYSALIAVLIAALIVAVIGVLISALISALIPRWFRAGSALVPRWFRADARDLRAGVSTVVTWPFQVDERMTNPTVAFTPSAR